MTSDTKKAQEVAERTTEDKLRLLYEMQLIDSEIDKIKILRGELPLEVQDLEDEIAGLQTRLSNIQEEMKVLEDSVQKKKNEIVDSQALIKKYQEQQMNVRNNREYDSLSKEIEFQTLEIELSEKRIREFSQELEEKKQLEAESRALLDERSGDLEEKKNELNSIISETQKEEEDLRKRSEDISSLIEDRLVTAYRRIRKNARNGLAVVPVERDACGGCFNKIPPQRQLDIKSRKKIIVCEYCGRILVDSEIMNPDSSKE
ncbi:MAG: C4-type zinc ribbon domain-containing protein [Bacteroidales bacterium]